LRDDLDDRIEDLSSSMADAGDEANEDIQIALEELRGERSKVDKAIDNVQDATEDSWESVKSNTEELADDVSDKLEEWQNELQDVFDN